MSRAKQRENRRMKHLAQQIGQIATEKPWLNSEGYHDPTAYEALRGVERWERSGRVARVA
jgi:hypothetical protein